VTASSNDVIGRHLDFKVARPAKWEGIMERVRNWRTDMACARAAELGRERVMFEAANPEVFAWYI
jgi:phosphosulfolactate synthase (CoM biosynthesis protein A)